MILEVLLKHFPSRTVAYINLGDAYWGLKEYDKAKQAYRTYIDQMKANGKEAKIPARIYERVYNQLLGKALPSFGVASGYVAPSRPPADCQTRANRNQYFINKKIDILPMKKSN